MQISYCDLCGAPLKDGNCYMFYITEPRASNFNEADEYYNYLQKVRRDVKEICPTCKHIFNKMFELRLTRLSELTDEINTNYNLPSKKNEKKQK